MSEASSPSGDTNPSQTPVDSDLPSHPARVLVTKIGLDGHDRGSRIVAAYLRDAGMEVIYTAPWQKISAVVNIALQEDVDVIGISSLATDHLLLPKLTAALAAADLDHIAVVVGGIIPDEEHQLLIDAGVAHVFHPGVSRDEIVENIAACARAARRNAMP